MAFRYSSSFRTRGVVSHLFAIRSAVPFWVLGLSLLCWFIPFCYTYDEQVSFSVIFPSGGRLSCQNHTFQASFSLNTNCIVHEYEYDEQTMFHLEDRVAAGFTINRSRQGDSRVYGAKRASFRGLPSAHMALCTGGSVTDSATDRLGLGW